MKKAIIIVATHKASKMPEDRIYLPVLAGADKVHDTLLLNNPLYTPDNTGENISSKNPCYGSQTALYWAWKNVEADYLGLVHYRRFFTGEKTFIPEKHSRALSGEELFPVLGTFQVFVPRKRRYFIETIYSHYAHTLDGNHLDLAREQIAERCPEYLPAFDTVMKQRWGYMFNMMIMRRDHIDRYCAWLFDILFEIEKRVDTSGMTDFEKRFCGRISELLFNVWLTHQVQTGQIKKTEIKELPYSEDVNWGKKIPAYLAAKVFHRKYTGSF